MISKLDFFAGETAEALCRVKSGSIVSGLAASFASRGRTVSLHPEAGGTLGLLFRADEGGRRRFLKTHLPSLQAKANLLKEIDILSFLYGDSIAIESLEFCDGENVRTVLAMSELSYPGFALDAQQVNRLVADYSAKLADYPNPHLISGQYHFEYLLNKGGEALDDLANGGLISQAVGQQVSAYLALLESRRRGFAHCICHGDLGPKNIMVHGGELVVLDWEDAFFGIEGYDYLYWLTFYENRPLLYTQNIFDKTPWGKDLEIAILLLVIVLKCALSVLAGSYLTNGMSFDRRILEILALA